MTSAPVIVLDFETTGMSPQWGDRPIEVGAVRLENDLIVDRFESLMNPGFPITWFIEQLTGISNQLVAEAPPCEEVMKRFADWIGDTPLVAHNASFDRKFLDAELALLGRDRGNPMACSMLAARRIFPGAINHKLATLVQHCGIFTGGSFHRALADAEMTGHVWIAMTDAIKNAYGLSEVPFALMQQLTVIGRKKAHLYLQTLAREERSDVSPCVAP